MNVLFTRDAISPPLQMKRMPKWLAYVALTISVAVGTGGCVGPYVTARTEGPRRYAHAPVYPGPSFVVEIGDRPYYTRGPGYYRGHSYYVWRPGHWSRHHGRNMWVHGRYALRR